jgi:predicted transcriptional regulator
MGYRYRNEIVASILQSVINARKDDGIRTTRIMYNSFLSYCMVTHYLKLLTENGSLEYDEPNKTYRITEAGLRVLELHNKIIEMLKVG